MQVAQLSAAARAQGVSPGDIRPPGALGVLHTCFPFRHKTLRQGFNKMSILHYIKDILKRHWLPFSPP